MLSPFRALFLSTLAAAAAAAPIVPASYSYVFSFPDGLYPDQGGTQLTDGSYNAVVPGASLATPDAYHWVGFRHQDGQVQFDFAESVTVDSVTFSMAYWTAAGVYLPTAVTIGGQAFAVDANAYTNFDKALLTFNGSWTGSTLMVGLTRGGEWTFLDEVLFTTGPGTAPSPVPEAGSTAALLGLALTFAGCARRGLARGVVPAAA